MPTSLTRRSALVTGTSYGIGAAIAIALAKAGCDVVITDLRSADPPATAAATDAGGGPAAPLSPDVCDQDIVEAAFAHALGPFAGAEPVRLDGAAVQAMRDRVLEQPEAVLSLLGEGRLEPEDLWPARGLGQLFALIARAGATAPWRELVRLGLREGWDARPEA